MFFDAEVWDVILIAIAAYLAVTTLVWMMSEYRKKMVVQIKTQLFKRQMARRRAHEEKEEQAATESVESAVATPPA